MCATKPTQNLKYTLVTTSPGLLYNLDKYLGAVVLTVKLLVPLPPAGIIEGYPTHVGRVSVLQTPEGTIDSHMCSSQVTHRCVSAPERFVCMCECVESLLFLDLSHGVSKTVP